jgi:DNA polymerase-1
MNKFDFCEACPLKDAPLVEPAGVKGNIAIVGEAPGANEVKQGQPFVGLSGQLLRSALVKTGINPKECWITNACLCRPDDNATPPPEAVQLCHARLANELRECRVVLTCGATALQSLKGSDASIQSVRGAPFWSDELDKYVIATYHPAAILRNADYFPDFALDIESVRTCPTEKIEPLDVKWTTVQSAEDIKEFHEWARIYASAVSLDIETTGLNEFEDDILTIGIGAYDEERSYRVIIIPENIIGDNGSVEVLDAFKHLVEDRELWWAGHNANQFDRKFLLWYGVDLQIDFDTMLAHYLIDERRGTHNLKILAREYCGAEDYEEVVRKKKRRGRLEAVPTEDLYRYNAYDAYYTARLAILFAQVLEENGLDNVFYSVILPASQALGEIETYGVMIDTEHLKKLEVEFASEIDRMTSELREMSGNPNLNPNSPKQVADVLYNKLKLRKTRGSTDKKALAALKHPFADKVLEIRKIGKLQSTYVKGILERLEEDGRIHADFLIHGTVTGRLSSRDPNLQNIPARGLGITIRDAFVASPGYTLIEADYSQLELRVAAWYSRDEKMVSTFADDEDIHTQVACQIFGIEPHEVTKDQRYAAKFVDFGIIYGRGAKSLAEGELQCSVHQAQRFLNNFLKQFPQLTAWMKWAQKQAVTEGYVPTAMGRRRRFPIILNTNRAEVERQAVNAPIQSAASDICLSALARLHNRLDPNQAHILLTVHDSILFEVKKGYESKALKIIWEEMVEEAPLESPFPFKVECKMGHRWGSLKEVEVK